MLFWTQECFLSWAEYVERMNKESLCMRRGWRRAWSEIWTYRVTNLPLVSVIRAVDTIVGHELIWWVELVVAVHTQNMSGGGPDPFCLSVILRTSVWKASWINLRLESLPHEVWRVLQSAGVEGGHTHWVTGEEGVELQTWNSSVRTRWRSCNQGKQRYTKNIERFARFTNIK